MDSDRVFEGEKKRLKCLFLYVCGLEVDRIALKNFLVINFAFYNS